jgi:hypothetical protein
MSGSLWGIAHMSIPSAPPSE